ncbi:unnamed protein product [Linum tenue]|uniref:Uncharacterized protein n=1 Tax=Linum tenue TaxID=586396 RepID=A0AAV0H377_9ROSI|nr:unnamed protein product [Linum tenue]CAI0429319.1 unnamed protein product [Linum tenue]
MQLVPREMGLRFFIPSLRPCQMSIPRSRVRLPQIRPTRQELRQVQMAALRLQSPQVLPILA